MPAENVIVPRNTQASKCRKQVNFFGLKLQILHLSQLNHSLVFPGTITVYCHIPEPAQRKYFLLMLGKFEAEKLPSFNEGGSEGGRQSIQYFRPSQQI